MVGALLALEKQRVRGTVATNVHKAMVFARQSAMGVKSD